jgi:DnaD/phage-associated family protein
MNIRINYGTAVATVPAAALAVMDRATKQDLTVLLTLAADPALLGGAPGECAGIIAARLGCPASQIETSLSFWRGAGVLTVTEESERITPAAPSLPEEKPAPAPESSKEEPKETRPARPRPAAELPRCTSAELADLLEARKDVNDFLRECQNVWGEMFNTHQTNTILGFVDYLGLEWDYILALLAFGVREQDKRGVKRSLRYVEKMAFDFYDEGITDLPALQEKIRRLEQTAEVEGSLRRMFGMGERALTPAEKKKFSTWLYEYQYGLDVITRAFEVTVDAKGSPNLKYMDAVLANWNRDGLRTLEDIEASEARFQAQKAEISSGHHYHRGQH